MYISLIEQCRQEILALHQFFEDWFHGRIDNTQDDYARFSHVLAEDFNIIAPSGKMTGKVNLLPGLRGLHGSWSQNPKQQIFVENFQGKLIGDNICLANYEEWQGGTLETSKGRLSTALLKHSPGKPFNVEWLHVHETWIS